MTDHTRSTGASGTMLIRDTGTTVEFWLNANNSTTFNHALPYNWIVNGASGSATFNYNAGSAWQKLRTFTVTTSQTVRFGIGSTGTSGFGGPTNFDVFIDRSTIPDAPTGLVLSSVTSVSAVLAFTDGYNGAAAIDSRQIGYGIDPSTPVTIIAASNSEVISGLTPGSLYYFWARTHNVNGYSAWSARVSATTLRVPDAPSVPTLSNIGPTSVEVSWTPNGDGGASIDNNAIGYNTIPELGTHTTEYGPSPHVITGLTPGVVYYVWVSLHNSVGWGPWGPLVSFRTLAGARVKIGTEWKFAIPYVRDGGVWKIAVPYVKDSGVWKQAI
jgi:hypothetical protein